MKIVNLKTEYKTNPLGIGTLKPRLSWEFLSEQRSTMQMAYQLKFASEKEYLLQDNNLLWDSGKIQSDHSVHIEYNGSDLLSGQRIYWKVKVWDNHGRESEWSEIAFWEMGLLSSSDWKALWIDPDLEEDISVSNPCPFIRKEFRLKSGIRKAGIYVSCYGLYQLRLNGAKVTDDLFTPGWTSYHHRLQYQVYDVTHLLISDKNALGVILGDGWYRGFFGWQGKRNLYGEKLALILQMYVTYDDGSNELIITDNSWKSSTGPILRSDIYNGEMYDARLEIDGWDKKGFDDHRWNGVVVKNHAMDVFVPSEGEAVCVTQTVKPVRKITSPKGEMVFDFGQNIVGWVMFTLKGVSGKKITLKHAEVLDKDGNFYTDNLRAAKAEDSYIFRSDDFETYEPHFTFHGFRYIKVDGYPGKIEIDNLAGRVIHSDMTPVGNFECSNPLVNQLQHNIQWGLRGNFLDVPTDCPQRDERMGWTGDAQVFALTACFNMNTAAFFTKWLKDLIVDQKPDGSVPWVVPMVVKGGGGTGWSDGYGAAGWADAAIIIPWNIYQVYGDKRILENQYNSMKAWIEFMRKKAGDRYIFDSGFHFGDWLAFATTKCDYPGATTDKDLIATAYFFYSTSLFQKIASVFDKQTDTDDYLELQKKIKTAFQKEFLTQTGRLSSNTQTAYVLSLAFDLIPEKMKKAVAKRLADDVRKFGHITTGFLGTPLICDVLTENGYPELAYLLLFRKEYPSWLYPITMGATTIWERWDGIRPDGSFQDAGMNSLNHYAYGAVGNWLYTKVAGISSDPERPGYKKIIIKPLVTDRLSYAKAEYHSVYGLIKTHWQLKGEKLNLNVVIPVNSTALIEIPAKNIENLYENNIPVSKVKDIKVIGIKDNRVTLEVGSGNYDFKSLLFKT